MKRNLIAGAMTLFLLGSIGIHAQNTPSATTPPTTGADTSKAADDSGQQPQQKLNTTETVTVTAGSDRAEQTIDQTSLLEVSPGTSPIEVLGRLPSVEVTGADPYGAYEWAVRISIRGFNQNQLGFTLDDVPLGDMTYGNLNGLHISRALIDENMGNTTLSQGTGSLETASNSNLGGTVQFGSIDPSDKAGVLVNQSFGSFNAYRTFVRFNSGLLPTKTKFYVSAVYQQADKWKGAGQIGQFYPQFNAKLTQEIGSKGLLTFYYDFSHRHEVDYQDLNKVWDEQLGYNWDNFGNWGNAVQAANAYNAQGCLKAKIPVCGPVFSSIPTTFPYPLTKLQSGFGDLSNDPEDAAYYGGSGLRKDNLTYISYKTALTNKLLWKTTVYGHINEGRGLWYTPYTPSPNATYTGYVSPVSLRTSEYGIHRMGFVTSLSYETPRNKVEGGAWFEDESFNLARRYYGTTLDSPVYSLYDFPKNPFYTQWAFNFKTTVYQLHLQDQFKITSKLAVSAGFKAIETNTDGKLTGYDTPVALEGYTATDFAQGSLESGKPFLPQFGADYKVDGHNEIFGDAAWNIRAYQAGGPGFGNSPWGTNQTGFDYIKTSLNPETAWSEEAGYRYTGLRADAEASYFHVNYAHRLLAISQGPGIAGAESTLDNVGGVTTNGFDASGTVPLTHGLSLYNAFTYSKSTYDSDYDTTSSTGAVTVVPTGGKVSVDSPQVLYKNELEYNYHGFNAHIASDFMGKRYFTYTDDNSVDGRFQADFGTSYTHERLGEFQDLKLQFNVYNLADAKYYSTIGTNGFVASDPTSVNNNTLQVGAPRTFTGTFSVKF